MSTPDQTTALNVLQAPKANPGEAPAWLRLVPEGRSMAVDGRGPFFYDDAAAVITASLTSGEPIFIDIDHSSIKPDVADRRAYGYVTELAAREDGIWGKVDWTEAGRALMADRAFWGVSPILRHTKEGKVTRIASVALTNNPALRQLTALTSEAETEMDLSELADLLGLPADASMDDVKAAIKKMKGGGADGEEALTALTAVRQALDLGDDAGEAEMVAVAKSLKESSDGTSETVAALTAKVKDLQDGNKRRDAEAFVDKAIAEKRPVKASRDQWVALHMDDPERAEQMIKQLPTLGETALTAQPPAVDEEASALTADEIADKAQAYIADCAEKGRTVDVSTAVTAVMEGKA